MGFFDTLSAAAVSFTVAGNTGVSPFLCLFMVGLIERVDEGALNMGGTIETLLSSWPSLVLLGIMTVLEFVSMCVPVVDEIVDSIMIFIIPVISTVGSMSTFGLMTQSAADGDHRELSAASGALILFQVCVVGVGIILALAIHALKMLVRLIGEGWLTNCLAVLEATWIVTTITMAIFIRQIAILVAITICCAAVFSIKRNYLDKRNKNDQALADQEHPQGVAMGAAEGDADDDYVKVEDTPEATVIAIESGDVKTAGSMKK
eukprot:CAMPEP_0119007070 /NCGR_PEP_ID=MMETSP1176-20130426/2748_1 /TAXON_ID=265551 /ORGANISM="Synedropsis recta cf, Strain CCMP1620" /LENGTH=261 /DNA_ID=CAMNT_0006959133 /DNA_START=39 /DNA_END=824 /DNA_ORIENTATION=-